ncbi:MAG: hypothetical protein A2Y74_08350 [Actinobacteria bacterium RBG_13_63_9]|nr:MAG: hypothetical protein A2Y74_08350 [Actinobacteria bacterium RBG_13_63_9]
MPRPTTRAGRAVLAATNLDYKVERMLRLFAFAQWRLPSEPEPRFGPVKLPLEHLASHLDVGIDDVLASLQRLRLLYKPTRFEPDDPTKVVDWSKVPGGEPRMGRFDRVEQWLKEEGARLGLVGEKIEKKRQEVFGQLGGLGRYKSMDEAYEALADWLNEHGAEPYLEWLSCQGRPGRPVV